MAVFPSGSIDTAEPTDARAVSQGDDRIRETRRYLSERMADIFVDANSSPLVVKDGRIGTGPLADLAVTTAKLAADAVTQSKIADDAVGTDQIIDDAVDGTKVADDSIDAPHLKANSVTSAKIADGAVGESELATSAVITGKVADGAITAPKIADDAVTTDKVLDEAITEPKLADDAVTELKIADGAVSPDKFSAAAQALLLEQRSVDIVVGSTAMGSRSTALLATTVFTGLVAGDQITLSIPTAVGDLSDASQRKLINYFVVAYANSVKLFSANPNDGPLTVPAGTFVAYCTKPKTDWP